MPSLQEFKGIEGGDFFESDPGFQSLLKDLLPEDSHDAVFNSLHHCGRLVGGRWNDLAREANKPEHLPKIVKFDRAGNPVEQIDWGSHARHLRREVAEFGVLTDVQNELHKFALVYLLAHNGEGSVNCGFSCTDGLIRAVEACGSDFLRKTYLPLLTSVDTPLAGAQFVTEPGAGSDVGAVEAQARPNEDGSWSITAGKWFCSNPDEYFLVAARPMDAPSGTAGVAVFLVPRVLPDGSLNRISFRRLKDKLGTRSLPTAEIDFNDATGWVIGDPADGFKTLMNYVINASRIHNAANACGMLHRAFLEARNYARQREAFGGAIIGYPLVQETLISLLERCWRYRVLTFKLIAMVDEHGIRPVDDGQAMWQRFLLNLAKYRTASTLTESIREAILILGGNGIIEDFTVLPRLLRDAMIIETWEGTHNTLCLQIVRDAAKSDLLTRWRHEIDEALREWPRDFLSQTRARFEDTFGRTLTQLSKPRLSEHQWAASHARRVVDRFGSLLEIAWMARTAGAHSNSDATAALLTAASAHFLFPGIESFDESAFRETSKFWPQLIDESAVNATVSAL
ncbi:MAG TPA: acyl-CoA dehydrogenase family protein [Blastocatellia bacterium]|nr:acyl-CoA dehydrogenase family protein [Blastocatellia bacterium]